MLDIFKQFKDFKAFEIIFHAEDNTPKRLICRLQGIENDRIIVHVDNNKNHNVFAKVNDSVQMNIYTELGVYSASSKVLSIDKELTITKYEIELPEYSRHSQRREYFRADINVKFLMNVTNMSNKTISIKGQTKDICGNGMSYISDEAFSNYSNIDLALFFDNRTVNLKVDLVYSRPQIVNSVCTKFINAFTFSEIAEKDIDFIVQQCFLYQLKLRKKAL